MRLNFATVSVSNNSGAIQWRLFLVLSPAAEKSRSIDLDVAGIERKLSANRHIIGKRKEFLTQKSIQPIFVKNSPFSSTDKYSLTSASTFSFNSSSFDFEGTETSFGSRRRLHMVSCAMISFAPFGSVFFWKMRASLINHI